MVNMITPICMKRETLKKIIKLSIASAMAIATLSASEATSVEEMFKNGELSGQLRVGHFTFDKKDNTKSDDYVSAIGGQLKYETALLYGLSMGVAMYTSHSIALLSGDKEDNKFNDLLTSSEKNYTELGEAYVNYTRDSFNLRVGRQQIDTPLADTDDWTMTPHTFEAVVASYGFEELGLTLIGANVQRWQGVNTGYENVLNNSWADTGDSSTNMVAALYANDMLESGIWYYDIGSAAKAVYADISATFDLSDDVGATFGVQYLDESQEANSNIEGSIAGVMAEVSFAGLTLGGAYNNVSVDNGDSIFEGFGGGSSYTNMFITTAATFNDGTYGDANSYSFSAAYEFMGVELSGAYAEFKADDIGNGKGDKSEMDLVASHSYNDGEIEVALGFVRVKDKIDSTNSLDRIQFFANYNF